jgi:uncharacterized protein YndB with AHSA1/START domain
VTKIVESIHIAASPTEVFRTCHDLELRPEWDARVDHIELQGLSNILRKGALVRVDSHAGSRLPFSWEGEYTLFSMPRGSTVRVMETALVSHFRPGSTEEWHFEPADGGTRFTIIWNYKVRGFLGRLYDRLYRRASAARAIRRSLAQAKELLQARYLSSHLDG